MNHTFRRHRLTLIALLLGLILFHNGRDGTAVIHADESIPVGCTNGIGDVNALSDAIEKANSDIEVDTIVLGQDCVYTLSGQTPINGYYGLPIVQTTLTIEGNGAEIKRGPISHFRLLVVLTGATLTINNLTLEGGFLPEGDGAAIYVDPGANLALNHVTLDSNQGQNVGMIYTQPEAMTAANHHFGPDVIQIKGYIACLNYRRQPESSTTVGRLACPL